MSGGRRGRNQFSIAMTADPGKDLFAYLFLMIMVFCFMLLMAAHETSQTTAGQASPEQAPAAANSGIAGVAKEKLGILFKDEGEIFIQFENSRYSPEKDIDRLRADRRLVTSTETDGEKKFLLYIKESGSHQLMLSEYLSAFQHLSRSGIGVAFAEPIDNDAQ